MASCHGLGMTLMDGKSDEGTENRALALFEKACKGGVLKACVDIVTACELGVARACAPRMK
jgi:hypothetical protein